MTDIFSTGSGMGKQQLPQVLCSFLSGHTCLFLEHTLDLCISSLSSSRQAQVSSSSSALHSNVSLTILLHLTRISITCLIFLQRIFSLTYYIFYLFILHIYFLSPYPQNVNTVMTGNFVYSLQGLSPYYIPVLCCMPHFQPARKFLSPSLCGPSHSPEGKCDLNNFFNLRWS